MVEFRTKGKGKNRKVYPISGKKGNEFSRYSLPRFQISINNTKNTKNKLITQAFIAGAINLTPMAREIYIGYTTANLLYSSWNAIYNKYKNPDTIKQEVYGFIRSEEKTSLTNYQTDIIWSSIRDKVPESFKNGVHNQLTNVMSNITEEEISLVESALMAF